MKVRPNVLPLKERLVVVRQFWRRAQRVDRRLDVPRHNLAIALAPAHVGSEEHRGFALIELGALHALRHLVKLHEHRLVVVIATHVHVQRHVISYHHVDHLHRVRVPIAVLVQVVNLYAQRVLAVDAGQ